ncbi:carbohydrate ABC transporter ATP-binding protein, CUT1 family [Anaerovirgula multivorans]|uniref:Carbohydrate ABC transporter ATP-binding protein, CUT1 family n=1 Tax=Anaerovirgula multivorans TaxID=312168 RepID=A0A239AR44_9FIRM|nr:ABC transporter ATP-binding protein [Anaerovirgula multivorans]SNR97782.1 carbohydrate ABC transporter ATP-binding protein, CUT1 family [Anaerovirgula multivorans]
MSQIVLSDINKYYDKVHVLKDVNLVVEDGDFMTLLGPSGCGKTTTLRVIAGLENPQEGRITIDNKEVTNAIEAYYVPPSKRGLNLVFQSYALWPHMTVKENVSFGLTIKKLSKKLIEEKVENALKRMRIFEYMDRYPSELSGGQQQRVAIARAIVSEPKILLLDEPLSNLDAKLRVDMRSELKRLHRDLNTTIIYVTHDQVEALTMSTKIAIFFEGNLVQVDTPKNIYNNPASKKVADFIGNPRINFIEGKCTRIIEGLEVDSILGKMKFYNNKLLRKNMESIKEKVIMALRPEHVNIKRDLCDGGIEGKIYSILPAGSETLIQVDINGTRIMGKVIGQEDFDYDQTVWLDIDSKKVNVFEQETENLIVTI